MKLSSGLSGAEVVEYRQGTVKKRGGVVDKTVEQGRWLEKHASPGFPTVYELAADGYVMERLEHVDYSSVKAEDVVEMLRTHAWSKPATTAATRDTERLLTTKVLGNLVSCDLVSDSDLVAAVLRATKRAASAALSLPAALAHGDPTAENVMSRRRHGLVLIDPIPATLAVPDAPCVDVGKMLQSASGWEAAKYGTDVKVYSTADVELAVQDDNMFSAGQAWAVVHVVRTLPYVVRNAPHALERVKQVLTNTLEAGGFYSEVVLRHRRRPYKLEADRARGVPQGGSQYA